MFGLCLHVHSIVSPKKWQETKQYYSRQTGSSLRGRCSCKNKTKLSAVIIYHPRIEGTRFKSKRRGCGRKDAWSNDCWLKLTLGQSRTLSSLTLVNNPELTDMIACIVTPSLPNHTDQGRLLAQTCCYLMAFARPECSVWWGTGRNTSLRVTWHSES